MMSAKVRMRFNAVVVSAILLGLPSGLAGTATAQENQAPLVRATTRLVQLNVVVLNKQNHPVTDLTKDDFRVFDNGVEQQIAHFTGATADAPVLPVPSSPLIINNRQITGNNPPGVTAILMDELILDDRTWDDNPREHDRTGPIRQMRLQVLDFLSKLPPGELVGIYSLRSAGVIVIHDFTDDPASLAAAAKWLEGEGVRGKSLYSIGSQAGSGLNRWTQNAPSANGRQTNQLSESPERLLSGGGFQAVVKHMQGLPGRKNLVFISSNPMVAASGLNFGTLLGAREANLTGITRSGTGTPQSPDPRNYFNELQYFGRWLGNANVAIYPFDALGLQAGGPEGPQSEDNRYPQWVAADQIANESGGRALVGHNSLSDDLQQIVTEDRQAYQMDYYPGDKDWDGKYHKIELKLKPEHRGLALLCRKGYYANDNHVGPSYESFRAAARGPVEAPGIGLTLNVPSNPIEWGPEEVVLKLDVHEIQFEQKGDLADANLAVAFVQVGKDGRILEGFTDDVALALQPDTYADAEQQGWFYTRELVVSGMAAKLRVVVRDRATGATGTVSVPIHPFSMKNAK